MRSPGPASGAPTKAAIRSPVVAATRACDRPELSADRAIHVVSLFGGVDRGGAKCGARRSAAAGQIRYLELRRCHGRQEWPDREHVGRGRDGYHDDRRESASPRRALRRRQRRRQLQREPNQRGRDDSAQRRHAHAPRRAWSIGIKTSGRNGEQPAPTHPESKRRATYKAMGSAARVRGVIVSGMKSRRLTTVRSPV